MIRNNTLRLAVRFDHHTPTPVIMSVTGAVTSQRYERPSELSFVEDGVRIAAGEGIDEVEIEGWDSLRSLIDDANSMDIVGFACADCAAGRDVAVDGDGALSGLEWVPSEDVRLPLHNCSKGQGTSERLQLITKKEQRKEQQEFDARVGRVTVGADRGED